jgi:uncharacterized protein YgbK (DUF1537 family)
MYCLADDLTGSESINDGFFDHEGLSTVEFLKVDQFLGGFSRPRFRLMT